MSYIHTDMLHNIKISPIPVNIGPDIPYVPKNYSGVDYQMGGTMSEYKNIKSRYQIHPPHPQNTLTPCSFKKNKINQNRICQNVYAQGVVGRVCNSIGTDGPLYSDNLLNSNLNNSDEWVRGNQFSVSYPNKSKVKYNYSVPVLKEEQKSFFKKEAIYPDKNIWESSFYKEYPHTRNYTASGYPIWSYPYESAIPPINIMKSNIDIDNVDNVDISNIDIDNVDISNIDIDNVDIDNIDNIDNIENFLNNSNQNYFWIGIIILILILFLIKIKI